MLGTPDKPRLSVFRSHRYIYAQLIDDIAGHTICCASSGKDIEAARVAGKTIGRQAKETGTEACVFDRGCYKYHGRVKALADGAREEGLRF